MSLEDLDAMILRAQTEGHDDIAAALRDYQRLRGEVRSILDRRGDLDQREYTGEGHRAEYLELTLQSVLNRLGYHLEGDDDDQ